MVRSVGDHHTDALPGARPARSPNVLAGPLCRRYVPSSASALAHEPEEDTPSPFRRPSSRSRTPLPSAPSRRHRCSSRCERARSHATYIATRKRKCAGMTIACQAVAKRARTARRRSGAPRRRRTRARRAATRRRRSRSLQRTQYAETPAQPFDADAEDREPEGSESERHASDSTPTLESRSGGRGCVKAELPGDPLGDCPEQEHDYADDGEDRRQIDADPGVRVVLTEVVDRSV